MQNTSGNRFVLDLSEAGADDVALVGGKGASLGELLRELVPRGVCAVEGFAVTSESYRALLAMGGLNERLRELLAGLDVNDLNSLSTTGHEARRMVLDSPLPRAVEDGILKAYGDLCRTNGRLIEVAVRSSATAEDLPEASFAGQQDTILNVQGERRLIDACRHCFASLWTDRAISYRTTQGFDHFEVACAICVQPMIRSDLACSGVMFTLDPESGFRDAVVINAAWGLGEAIVQGMSTPDEWIVFKPTLHKGVRPIISRRLGSKEVKTIYDLARGSTCVREVVEMAIDAARRTGKKIGICGQAPSDFPEFARFLVERGISSISLNPDTVIQTTHSISEAEAQRP